MSDLVRKADVLPIFCMRCVRVIDCVNDVTGRFKNNCPIKKEVDELPTAEPERVWHPVEKPPAHHKDVIVRGVEDIGNVTVHKVMQWDVDTWRPTNYAPSIMWTEWSEI